MYVIYNVEHTKVDDDTINIQNKEKSLLNKVWLEMVINRIISHKKHFIQPAIFLVLVPREICSHFAEQNLLIKSCLKVFTLQFQFFPILTNKYPVLDINDKDYELKNPKSPHL